MIPTGTILRANPALPGVVFELTRVAGRATLPVADEAAGRRSAVAGDTPVSVPSARDIHPLKRVLMDKGDQRAVRVLGTCAWAMAEGGKALVVDCLVPPGNEPSISMLVDLTMLVYMRGGRIRTAEELR